MTYPSDRTLISNMALHRISENFLLLKDWDTERAASIDFHKRLISSFYQRINLNLENYNHSFNQLRNYLDERAALQLAYSKHSSCIPSLLFSQDSTRELLSSVLACNSAQKGRSQRVYEYIKKVLIGEVMDEFSIESSSELQPFIKNMENYKDSLDNVINKCEEYSRQLTAQFHELKSKVFESPHDFFLAQLKFMKFAYKQVDIQKAVGQLVINFYKKTKQIQLQRRKTIRLVLEQYATLLKENYRQLTLASYPEYDEESELKQVNKDFNLMDFIEKDQLKHFEELGQEALIKFVDNFSFKPFNNSILKLKQFLGSREVQDGDTQTKIILTVQGFLHCFQCNQDQGDPALTLKIDQAIRITEFGDRGLRINKKQRSGGIFSLLLPSKTDPRNQLCLSLKLKKKDERIELQETLQKIIRNE